MATFDAISHINKGGSPTGAHRPERSWYRNISETMTYRQTLENNSGCDSFAPASRDELWNSSSVGSIHLISGQRQAGIDDLLATEQERVGLESDVAIVGILRVDRRFNPP